MIQHLRRSKRVFHNFFPYSFPIPISLIPYTLIPLLLIPYTLIAQGSGYTLNLDGVDDFADMGDQFNTMQFPFSVSAWIYWEGPLDGSNAEYGIVTGDDHPGRTILFIRTGVYSGYTLFVRGDGSLNMRIGDGGNVSPNSRRDKWSPANIIPLNQWTHVAGVVRGLTDMDLYVNGINVGGIYDGNGGNMSYSGNPLTIGRYRKDPGRGEEYFFDGKIDEVRIWEVARTEAEIRRDMCQSLLGNENGLMGYWKMDEGPGGNPQGSGPNAIAGNLINENPNTIWEVSAAPIGDQSEQVYETNWNGIDLDLSLVGNEFSVDQIQGNLQGIHIYLVNAPPNQLIGTPPDQAPILPYYGTFMATANSAAFNGSYQVNLNYDPSTLGPCNPEASLYYRDHNADENWEALPANSTPTELTFTPNTQRGEFIMTYVPCIDTPGCSWEGIAIALSDSSTCEGRNVDFSLFIPPTNTSDNFLVSWAWDFGDGTQSDQLDAQHFYDTAGEYTITLELTNIDGCDTSLTQNITIIQDVLPQVAFEGDTAVCSGEQVSLNIVPIGNAQPPFTVEWDTGDSLVASVNEVLTQSKTYPVRISNNCQTLNEEIFVAVSPSLVPEIDVSPVSCFGGTNGSAQVQVSGGIAPYRTDWNGSGNAEFMGDEWLVQAVVAGFYEVNLFDSLGCPTPISFTIEEPAAPLVLALLSTEPDFCNDSTGSISLSASGGNGGYQYLWDDQGTSADPMLSQLVGGEYQVKVIDSQGCEDSLTVSVPQEDAPELAVKTVPGLTEAIPFEEVASTGIQFVALSPNAARIEWDLGDSTVVELAEFIHLYGEPGTYEVQIRAYADQEACFTERQLSLTLIPTETLFLPTAFSPNGDGINDTYVAVSMGTLSTKMSIYDQWGQLILQQENDLVWNGVLSNGKQAPEGVYVVKLEAEYDTFQHSQTATITLIR
ncbi:MAG: LamG-like jellyroll fold domain-containing protein [Bacteroidota bacterium]